MCLAAIKCQSQRSDRRTTARRCAASRSISNGSKVRAADLGTGRGERPLRAQTTWCCGGHESPLCGNATRSSWSNRMHPSIIRRTLPGWGTTYGPSDEGKSSAILILHGSEGGTSGWSHRTAALLAADGFLCYPHSYSKGGNAWNAGHIEDVEIEHTVQALSALRSFAPCNGKVAVYGVSRGAEHALLLAALMSEANMQGQPDSVACLAAPDVVCGAFDARCFRDSGDPGWQPWDPSRRAWMWQGSTDKLLPSEPINVEAYSGPLFLSVGLKDQTWSPEMTKRLHKRRKANGKPVEAHYYADEGHLPGSEGENRHYELLLSFLKRTIGP